MTSYENKYSVYVNGDEVNYLLLTLSEALNLQDDYLSMGYNDVIIKSIYDNSEVRIWVLKAIKNQMHILRGLLIVGIINHIIIFMIMMIISKSVNIMMVGGIMLKIQRMILF